MNYLTPKQQKWRQIGPCITDFTYENNIDWPVTSCKWGPIVQETKEYIRQKVYFAIKTDGIYDEVTNIWKQTPCQLIVATVDIPQVKYQINHQVTFVYQQLQFYKNPHLKIRQMIVHPGDVNIIKCNTTQKLIATKSDNSNVLVWDVTKHKTQQNPKDPHAGIPEIYLMGHSQQGHSTALDWSQEYKLGSGGKDCKILLWDINDYQTRLSTSSIFTSKRELSNICGNDSIKLDKRTVLTGHQAEVVDMSFNKFQTDQLISCCQNRQIICWDQRIDGGKCWNLNDVHKKDIHCVSWSQHDENYIASGSLDGSVHIIDIRKPIGIQDYVKEVDNLSQVYSLQFGPDRNHLTIGSEELYSVNFQTKETTFCYFGHKGSINDFDINDKSPWTYVSTCQEHEYFGGGCLHIYRLLDLVYLNEEEAFQQLNN
ncbi:unnamed protein product [Paramecium sonneborni]|uniref:Uncharacterized protein n=1 Tax=Paramecium sonneborni TaxID=65129 RepID=A0A8S1RAL3_9CILI|nr:unnamed protein product [Paramecium sonneborni]